LEEENQSVKGTVLVYMQLTFKLNIDLTYKNIITLKTHVHTDSVTL